MDKEIQFLKQEIEENHSNMQKNRYSKNPSKLNFEQGNASNMRGGSLLQGPTYRSQNQLTLNGSQQALGLQSLPE